MKRPLTRAEHEALGAELYAIRERLVRQHVDLANRYGKTKRQGRLADRACRAVDALRCEMDDQFARDHPGEFDPAAYYGGSRP